MHLPDVLSIISIMKYTIPTSVESYGTINLDDGMKLPYALLEKYACTYGANEPLQATNYETQSHCAHAKETCEIGRGSGR